MNILGARPLMQTPPLPRITTQPQAAEGDGGDTAGSMQRRAVGQADRRSPAWRGQPVAPAPVTKQPGRFASQLDAKRPGCFVTKADSPPASRAARPGEAVARIVHPAFERPLKQGNLIRLVLGELVIELVLKDSRLYGKVLAETTSAKDLIESHLDDLRQGLERKGVEIGKFEVIVAEPEPELAGEPPLRSIRRLNLDVLA
jgi:hypothetical protein